MRSKPARPAARRNWSRAYFIVLALSLILILPSSFILATLVGRPVPIIQTARGPFRFITSPQQGLFLSGAPWLPRTYLWLGPWGILALGHGAALAILALCVRRTKLDAMLIALAILLLALLVLWAGPVLGQFPWRPSDAFQYFQF